jgi:hypothetical protein
LFGSIGLWQLAVLRATRSAATYILHAHAHARLPRAKNLLPSIKSKVAQALLFEEAPDGRGQPFLPTASALLVLVIFHICAHGSRELLRGGSRMEFTQLVPPVPTGDCTSHTDTQPAPPPPTTTSCSSTSGRRDMGARRKDRETGREGRGWWWWWGGLFRLSSSYSYVTKTRGEGEDTTAHQQRTSAAAGYI